MVTPATTIYYAYLLRCWKVGGTDPVGPAVLRFSLEDPHTGKQQAFAGCEALVAFLQSALAEAREEPDM